MLDRIGSVLYAVEHAALPAAKVSNPQAIDLDHRSKLPYQEGGVIHSTFEAPHTILLYPQRTYCTPPPGVHQFVPDADVYSTPSRTVSYRVAFAGAFDIYLLLR